MGTDKIIEHESAEQNRTQLFAFAIAAFIAVIFSCCFAGWSAKSKQPPRLLAQSSELEGRINPNIASMASLMRLPQIGTGRAEAIIAYRENVSRGDNNSAAFCNCDDLQKVKGIGSETVENLCKWLKFE
jgi:competence ComEA-like helix-hairpin-helix protein